MKLTPSSIAAAVAVKRNMQTEHLPFAAFLVGLLQNKLKKSDQIVLTYKSSDGEITESITLTEEDMKLLEKLRKTMW